MSRLFSKYDKPCNIGYFVLRRLEEASRIRDERVKFAFGKDSWEIGKRYKELPPSGKFSAEIVSQISQDYHQLKCISSLLNALKSSASELEELYEKLLEPIASTLSRGLSSLPDELVALICKFATEHKHKGTKQAIWLSQVSRRFRKIVLGDCSLWTTLNLWYDTTKEELGRIISRSGAESDLHAVINLNRSISFGDASRFLDGCSHSASRWRTLTIVGDWDDDDNAFYGITMNSLLGQMFHNYDLSLPRLEELSVSERHFDERADEPFWCSTRSHVWHINARPWITPRLRTLRSTNFIPLPSFPFTSITTFDLSLTLIRKSVQEQISDLVAYLPAMPNITNLKLVLKNDGIYPVDDPFLPDADILSHAEAVCPSITSFDLHVLNFEIQVDGNQWLEPIAQALLFPNLDSFSLTIGLMNKDVGCPKANDLLPSFLRVLIPDPVAHPLLTNLKINLPFPEDIAYCFGTAYAMSRRKDVVLTIPLDHVTNVSRMTISSCGRVMFCRPTLPGANLWPVDSCRLREVLLDSCEDMDGDFLHEMIQSLKAAGAWNTIVNISFEGCSNLDDETA